MKDVTNYPLLSNQVSHVEIAIILRELLHAIARHRLPDAATVVEFGCYTGTTSVFLQRLLQEQVPAWELHVYDSFCGLPTKSAADMSVAGEQFKAGELAASKAVLIHNFKHASLPVPVIHKGWFSDLTGTDVPQRIAFAFLDGDYYQSITDSFGLITPRLTEQATIVVDDYQSPALPGASKAVQDWLRTHPDWDVRHQQSLAILTKHPGK